MAAQLDLSLLASISDPVLRASLERLGNAMDEAPPQADPELSSPSGANIIQFPLFPSETRPVSNDMARSALFSCVQGNKRRWLKNAVLATVGDVRIEFTGEQLNQDDCDTLMQLVFMARNKPLGQFVVVSAYAVLKGLGRKHGGHDHEQLRQEIERLTKGSVAVRGPDINYVGHLIDESLQDLRTRRWLYRFNINMRMFFGLDNYTLIEWERRKNLKRKDLARWLQLYWSTHSRPFPVSVDFLREKSGSQTAELREFRRMLRRALNDLTGNGDVKEWKIERPGDLVYVDRGRATSKAQVRHLTAKKNNGIRATPLAGFEPHLSGIRATP
jgi:TrfA protein